LEEAFMAIKAVVWGENVHEQTDEAVRAIYPQGMHATIAAALNEDDAIRAGTATLQEPEHGLPEARLAETDVLVWWGHAAHDAVADAVVERVQRRVWEGMGLIVLHSGHFSKVFRALMGTPCALKWREAGERERLWVVNRNHPIAAGLGERIELANEEMYGEPFGVPEPLETVFISWFEGGEVFRSGLTYQRGGGRIFYFRPGHETYPTYHDADVRRVLRNAVRWAWNPAAPWTGITQGHNVPVGSTLEPLVEKGPKLASHDKKPA
jgi:trehalose utilization protein